MSFNRVFLLGRLGQDPELRYTPNQIPVASFSLATSEFRVSKEGQKTEQTEWHRIIVWNKQAELCSKYLLKGRQVFIEGRIQTRNWEDKNGQKRQTTEIIASAIQFIGPNPATSPSQGTSFGNQDMSHGSPDMDLYSGGEFPSKTAQESQSSMFSEPELDYNKMPF